MSSYTQELYQRGLIKPPKYVNDSLQYETIMGSAAYGVANIGSDMDLYGFCIPPKEVLFPHLNGQIPGFGKQVQKFEQYQEHHIKFDVREYDITIYNIVKYFQLCMENNPNMIDSLFTDKTMVTYATEVGNHVRNNARIFLHKGCWHKFKGYAYSQLNKCRIKNPEEGTKRWELKQKFGYDTKFAYHIVRLILEVEQILTEETLDLRRNNKQLISVRNGEWTLDDIERWFNEKESELEKVYHSSSLPYRPDEQSIKALLEECLEIEYGSLSGIITTDTNNIYKKMIDDIRKIVR